MNTTKMIGLFSTVLLLGTVACGKSEKTESPTESAPAAAEEAAKVTVKNGHSYRSQASAKTTAALGIKTWHLLTQKDSRSIVIEGEDASGKVLFASAIQKNGPQSVRIDSYKTAPGKFTLEKRADGRYWAMNTIAMDEWSAHMNAFSSDAKTAHVTVEYGVWGDRLSSWGTYAFGAAGIARGAAMIASVIPGGQPAAAALAATSVALAGAGLALKSAGKIADELEKPSADDKNANENDEENENETANENEKDNESETGETGDETGDENTADENTADENTADENTADENTADENTADDSDNGGSPEDEGDLGADSGDENLDDMGGDDGSSDDFSGDDGIDDGSAEDSSSDDSGDDGSSDDSSGDDSSGDDSSSNEEYAAHAKKHAARCRHLSCSKTTKVCICARY